MGFRRLATDTNRAVKQGKLLKLLSSRKYNIYFKMAIAAMVDFEKNLQPKLLRYSDQAHANLVEKFPTSIDFYCAANIEETRLGELFSKFGSDKQINGYDHLYAEILKGRENHYLVVVEIGIGSNNVLIQGNMGAGASFGAALFALEKYLPKSIIIGADIDPKCTTIKTKQIECFCVDQTNKESFVHLKNYLDRRADLIIVDGLHSLLAELNSIDELLYELRENGSIIIEDVFPKSIPAYEYLKKRLPQEFTLFIHRFKCAYVIQIRRNRLVV
jgi:hypothetical protein